MPVVRSVEKKDEAFVIDLYIDLCPIGYQKRGDRSIYRLYGFGCRFGIKAHMDR